MEFLLPPDFTELFNIFLEYEGDDAQGASTCNPIRCGQVCAVRCGVVNGTQSGRTRASRHSLSVMLEPLEQ